MLENDGNLSRTMQVLDAMALRARVALHNLSNQDTPGFKRYEVRFEDLLREARGDEPVRPVVVRDESGPAGQNNVAAEEELALLMKARLANEVFLRRLGGHFQRLRAAIGAGGR